MSEQEREQQLTDWFAERGLDLYFDQLGDEWVALALPQDTRIGAAASEHGATKIEAAELLQAKIDTAAKTVEVGTATETSTARGVRVVGAAGAPVEIPDTLRTRLEAGIAEFGWTLLFAREPDGSLMWAVFDEDGNPLHGGVATSWDDAKLNAIENLYPPSDEGSR